MALGHYQWTNNDPTKSGYGEVIDIDVDTLPTTGKPSNHPLPNLHFDEETGRLYVARVPNFYLDADTGIVYHSTFGQ